MWFLIATFWLFDAGIELYRHRGQMALLTLGVVALFAVIGLVRRRAELARESVRRGAL